MNFRKSLLSGLAIVVLTIPVGVSAQVKEVTVTFLRAASGSLPDHATVSFDAVYNSDQGLVEAQGWNMRGQGISHFSLKDPQSSVIFPNFYCSQDSKAFKELIKLNGTKLVHVTGYKGDGERNETAIYITGLEVLQTPIPVITEEQNSATNTFRVIIKDTASGSKTILANVIPGKSYTVDTLTLTVEPEKASR